MAREGQEAVADLVEVLVEAIPETFAVYLFGSAAAGDAGRGSDLDLAVLPTRPVAAERLARVKEELAEVARRDVDLVDLSQASTVLRAQIVSKGELLLDTEPAQRERFETTVYSAYARLNEERRGILERIQREGRIHGR